MTEMRSLRRDGRGRHGGGASFALRLASGASPLDAAADVVVDAVGIATADPEKVIASLQALEAHPPPA